MAGLYYISTGLCSILIILFGAVASASEVRICPSVLLRSPVEPELSSNEKSLICGFDPSDPKSEGWEKIPPEQAVFTLRNFLQERGYHEPAIEVSRSGELRVHSGMRARVSEILVQGGSRIDASKLRLEGEPLVPQLLSRIEKYFRSELAQRGHPCGEVETRADPRTGRVTVAINPGPEIRVESIESVGVMDFDPSALRRFDSFRPGDLGDLYDERRFAISADRAISDGMVERTSFAPVCSPARNVAKQTIVPGGTHSLNFGFGINSEELGLLRLSWARVRMGNNLSSFRAEASASSKVQSLAGTIDYPGTVSSRFHVVPRLSLMHQNESPFEFEAARIWVAARQQFDSDNVGYSISFGPEGSMVHHSRWISESTPKALSARLDLQAISHEYEFFKQNVRSGYRTSVSAGLADRGVLSSYSAGSIEIRGERAWNVGQYEAPLLVLVTRLRGGVCLIAAESRLEEVPVDCLQFLGGAANLRGFGRMEISGRDSRGGRSSGVLSVEAQPAFSILAPELQPIVFTDLGVLGQTRTGFQAPVYVSPGAGLRWKSPAGPFLMTAAHGVVIGEPAQAEDLSHWQLLLSLGEPL